MTRSDHRPPIPGRSGGHGRPGVSGRGLAHPAAERREVEQIRAFLCGATSGADLWHALYDHILDEPVPNRLRALLKR